MTTKDKVARGKLSLLELAQDLDNVSRACRIMGHSCQSSGRRRLIGSASRRRGCLRLKDLVITARRGLPFPSARPGTRRKAAASGGGGFFVTRRSLELDGGFDVL